MIEEHVIRLLRDSKKKQELADYIKENVVVNEHFDFMHYMTIMTAYIRIPFRVVVVEKKLDSEKIIKMNLKLYGHQEDGIDVFDDDTFLFFKFGMRHSITPELEYIERKFMMESTIKDMIERILETLRTGTMEENIHGYCDDSDCWAGHGDSCSGHVCGQTIYYIDEYNLDIKYQRARYVKLEDTNKVNEEV
jgi:hypothetical protein